MKNDTTMTVLNFVLALLVVLGVTFALMSIWRTRDLRAISPFAMQANSKAMMYQSLVSDVNTYNVQAKSPEVTRILQSLQAKPAAHTAH
jgi:HAMP domain-containing protein